MKRLSEVEKVQSVDLSILDNMSMPLIERIEILETQLKCHQQQETSVTEYFANGVYVREVVVPAGTFAIGGLHKFDHISIMVSGSLSMWTEYDGLQRLSGYNVVNAKAGVKRAGVFLEETKWVTAHANPENRDDMLEYLTVPTYKDFKKFKQNELRKTRYLI
jgi:hypothetical protein